MQSAIVAALPPDSRRAAVLELAQQVEAVAAAEDVAGAAALRLPSKLNQPRSSSSAKVRANLQQWPSS
jgi:hypothetical protein